MKRILSFVLDATKIEIMTFMRSLNIVIVIAILLVSHLSAFSQEYTMDSMIVNMLDVTGSEKQFRQVITTILDLERENYADLLEKEFWDEMEFEFIEKGYEGFLEILIPIYRKHLSEEEVMAITEFYSSEIGQKFINKLPVISAESMQAGAELGGKLGTMVAERMDSIKKDRMEKQHVDDCSKLRIGEYYSFLSDSTIVEVTRSKDLQIEKVGESVLEYRIEWIGPCRYYLHDFSEDKTDLSLGEPLEVNIYELIEGGYRYISKQENSDLYHQGQVWIRED